MPARLNPFASRRRPPSAPAPWWRAPLELAGAAVLVGVLAGCDPAQSNDGGSDNMILGLFKKKFATTVSPQVGAALVAAPSFPAAAGAAKSTLPAVRNVSVDAAPPAGKLARTRDEHPPAEAWVVDATAGQPAIAVVNTYGDDDRKTTLWQLDPKDPSRLGKQRGAPFDAAQSKWIMYSAGAVIALPANQLLIHLGYHQPRKVDGLFVYDIAADRMRSLGEVQPDWSQGLPFRFVDTLQVAPDALLVRYQTENERLGPQRYVNHFEHLVLFSPRHRDGLEIVTLGLDDGSIRRWGMADGKLWLQTSDDRTAPPRGFVWSLDLGKVI